MVTRKEIQAKVYAVIAAVSQRPVSGLSDSRTLRQDLLLAEALIASLSVPWTRIAKSYLGGLSVSLKESKATKTVGNCVDLVTIKANGGEKP
jgi:hypothetical protein